jgi:iron complex outermembrane receptor protein
MNNFICLFLLIPLIYCQSYSQKEDSIKYHLAPITITATRFSESWIETPLAVTRLEKFELKLKKGYGLDEAISIVPGVLGQSRYGNQDVRLTIRGFGARGAGERSNTGTSRGIKLLLDGFPETEPDGRTSFDFIDVSTAAHIEVVRSNVSSLWGNATGGIISISSNTSFERPYIDVSSSFGSFGYRKEALNLGTSLGNGKFYLSLGNTNYKGWREHSGSTRSLINTGIVSPLGNGTTLGIYLTAASNLFNIPGPLTQLQFSTNPKQAQGDTANYLPTYIQRDERRFNRQGRIGVNISHEFNAKTAITAMVFASPKYLQRSERNTYRDFNRHHVGGSFTFRNNFSLTENITSILLVGMDEAYQDGSILFYTLKNGQRGDSLTTNKREGANNFGGFAQKEFKFNDILSVFLGVRYDHITYYSENFKNQNLNAIKVFKQVTPKAGITYRFSPTHSLYANIGGGVEVPAGNETDPPNTFGQDTITSLNPLLEPIHSTTIEVGTKQILSGENYVPINYLMYDVALYIITVRNDIVPYRDGRFYFTAGKTRRIGAEIGFTINSTYGLTLQSSFTYSNNKYIEYVLDSVHYKKPGKFSDLKDNKIPGIPSFFYKINLRFIPPWFEMLYGECAIQGVSKYFADDMNTITVPSYNIINMAIGFDNLIIIGERLELKGFFGINNLVDRRYAASAFINPDLDRNKIHPIYLEPGLPRNYIGSVSLSWNF